MEMAKWRRGKAAKATSYHRICLPRDLTYKPVPNDHLRAKHGSYAFAGKTVQFPPNPAAQTLINVLRIEVDIGDIPLSAVMRGNDGFMYRRYAHVTADQIIPLSNNDDTNRTKFRPMAVQAVMERIKQLRYHQWNGATQAVVTPCKALIKFKDKPVYFPAEIDYEGGQFTAVCRQK